MTGIEQIENLRDKFKSNYALEENGYNQAIDDVITLLSSLPVQEGEDGKTKWDAEQNELYKALQDICGLFSEYHEAKTIAIKAMAKYKYPSLTGSVSLSSTPSQEGDKAPIDSGRVFDENADYSIATKTTAGLSTTPAISREKFIEVLEQLRIPDAGMEKPLNEITDIEALEVATIIGGASHLSDESKIAQVREVLERRYNQQTNVPAIKWYRAFKYLESLGYKIDE